MREAVAILDVDLGRDAYGASLIVVIQRQVAPAETEFHAHGGYPETASRSGTVTPRTSGDDAGESAHRVDEEGRNLACGALATGGAVVEQEVGCAVKHLAHGGPSDGGGDDIVGGGVFTLHAHLPHRASANGKKFRLPEIETIASSSIEKYRAVIRVCKHIGTQMVVIPFKPMTEIRNHA